MKNKIFPLFILMLSGASLLSCSAESFNALDSYEGQGSYSYLATSLVNSEVSATSNTLKQTEYMASLTNTLNEIPPFKDKKVNNEVIHLKEAIKSYIYAIRKNDAKARDKAHDDYIDSFIKLQKLRKDLPAPEARLLKHYLTKIKANINSLEYIS